MPVEAVAHGGCRRGRVRRESLPVEAVAHEGCRRARVRRGSLGRRVAPLKGYVQANRGTRNEKDP